MTKFINYLMVFLISLYILACTNILVVLVGLWILTAAIPFLPKFVVAVPFINYLEFTVYPNLRRRLEEIRGVYKTTDV